MQFDVNIRLYEYWHEQAKIRKKRLKNKEMKKFHCKKICKQKVRKRGVVGPCNERLCQKLLIKLLDKISDQVSVRYCNKYRIYVCRHLNQYRKYDH